MENDPQSMRGQAGRAQAGRGRTIRRALIALVIIAVIASAAFFLLFRFTEILPFGGGSGGAGGLAEGERLIPVRQDSLATEISINGSIVFSNKKDMTFGSTGFVDEILVSEGEVVAEGQELARLDPESVADLRRAVAAAELEHEDALDALDDARQPALATAEAEGAVAAAALELHEAQTALDELLNPKPEAVASAEAAVADAELAAHTAQDTLDTLLEPKAETIAAAENALAQARSALRDAEVALDRDLANANNDLEIARRDLAVAQINLDAISPNAVKQAQDAYEHKRRDYENVIYKWTGVAVNEDDIAMTPAELFGSMGFDADVVYVRDYDALFPEGRLVDNADTRWNELKVFGWLALYPTSNLIQIRCDHYTMGAIRQSDTSNTNGEFCIERDVRNAYDDFVAAHADLVGTEAQYDAGLAAAQDALLRAQTAQEEAQEAVDRLTDGNVGAMRLQAEFDKAQADYDAAQETLDDLTSPDAVEVESAREQVELAQANSAAAADALNDLLNPDAELVDARRSAVELAQAKLDAAESALDRLARRGDMQVALSEGEVAAAQAKVDGALRRLDDSTLKSPWDGYISAVPLEEGEEIEPFTVVLTVINSSIVQIEGEVDEIDVLSVERGDPTVITMDALPDQTLEGVISSVSSTATNQQGVVTFAVKIDMEVPDDVRLQEGLSAVAKVVISEERGLVIPVQAVRYGEQGAYVRVPDADGNIVEHPITLGSSDGFYAIVAAGLSEGDRIVMEVLSQGEIAEEFGPPGPGGGGEDRPRGPGIRRVRP